MNEGIPAGSDEHAVLYIQPRMALENCLTIHEHCYVSDHTSPILSYLFRSNICPEQPLLRFVDILYPLNGQRPSTRFLYYRTPLHDPMENLDRSIMPQL